jgi:MFS family permease
MNVARRYPRFRRLLASLAVSQAGDWLYNLALLAFVFERTHSSAWLGITTAARVLPIVVCGPLGGVVADRCDRRRLMLASDAVRFVLMLALALVAAAGLPVVLAPIIAALATAASSAYIPSVAATTPRLVDDADLPAANAARSAIQQVCIVAGPGFGALLLLLLGPPSLAFAINGATFALSALAVASIPAGAVFAPGGDGEAAPNVLRELCDARSSACAAPSLRWPIERLVSPLATRRRTSSSRAVRPTRSAALSPSAAATAGGWLSCSDSRARRASASSSAARGRARTRTATAWAVASAAWASARAPPSARIASARRQCAYAVA